MLVVKVLLLLIKGFVLDEKYLFWMNRNIFNL